MAINGRKSSGSAPARKVMVIADATRESAAALQYTLSHAILENDTLILLHVENNNFWKNTLSFFRKPSPSNQTAGPGPENATSSGGGGGGGGGSGMVDLSFLDAMKQICEKAQSKIQVTTEVVEMDGRDKASVILAQCMEHGVDLLVIGQRRSLSNAILGKQMRNGSLRGIDTAEYLIEKSKCTCVAVQKKGQNAGYLLNTKTQRDFWLLA